MFFLFNLIFSFILGFIDGSAGLMVGETGQGILGAIYSLFVLLPSIAVGVRRLHDIGKSGWWMFIVFIPIIGGIYLLVLFATEGDNGSNEYGPDPKQDWIETEDHLVD